MNHRPEHCYADIRSGSYHAIFFKIYYIKAKLFQNGIYCCQNKLEKQGLQVKGNECCISQDSMAKKIHKYVS